MPIIVNSLNQSFELLIFPKKLWEFFDLTSTKVLAPPVIRLQLFFDLFFLRATPDSGTATGTLGFSCTATLGYSLSGSCLIGSKYSGIGTVIFALQWGHLLLIPAVANCAFIRWLQWGQLNLIMRHSDIRPMHIIIHSA